MTAANSKITYTAAEVAELIRPLTQSVEALQKENAALKRKLEHMNEVLANAQRVQYGRSSEKKSYVLSEDQMSLFNEAESCQDHKAEEPAEETFTVKAHARKKKRTIGEQDASPSYEALPGICLHGGRCHDKEICGRRSVGKAGEDLGKAGRGAEPCNFGQLGDPVYANLAEASVQAYEAAASDPVRDPCG